MKLLPSIKDLLFTKNQKVGVITNYSTEEFLKRDFITRKMNIGEYETIIERDNIEVVFIEREIYEVDHQWYGLDIESIINHVKKMNVNIIIIDNTKKNKLVDGYPSIVMDDNFKSVENENHLLTMPFMINEKILNPIRVRKTIDILSLKFESFNEEYKSLMKTVTFKTEIISITEVKRSTIKRIISKLKSARVIYIPFNEKMDSRLLKYIELAAAIQNTVTIIDPKYSFNVKHAIKVTDQESTMHYLQAFTNDGLYLDKKVISASRKVFMKNTLIQYEDFEKLLQGNVMKRDIKISIITSTKRKWTLKDYIDRLNSQKNVTLQVVLLTHGFQLSQDEQVFLKNRANFELEIIYEDKSTVFGTCLNKCVDLTKYDYFTKMDDDDYYYPNYLIDSWIGKKYSGADIVGKYSQFVYLEGSGMTIQRFGHLQYQYSKYVAGATIFCETKFMREFMFSEKSKAVDSDIIRRVLDRDGKLYCIHPYEFCIFRADDKGEHTWQIPDITLLRSADVLFYENPGKTLTID